MHLYFVEPNTHVHSRHRTRICIHGHVHANALQAWDKIVAEMRTQRTAKQLQDHWSDRQQQCMQLLREKGPPDRFDVCVCVCVCVLCVPFLNRARAGLKDLKCCCRNSAQ
jgi:hypothetical protein